LQPFSFENTYLLFAAFVSSTPAIRNDKLNFSAARAESLLILEEFNFKLADFSRQAAAVTLTPLQIQIITQISLQTANLINNAITGAPLNTDLLSVLINAAATLITPSTTVAIR
jgi:hypothetical protein